MENKEVFVFDKDEDKLMKMMDSLIETNNMAHSEYQIRNFILNEINHPGAVGKYHQAVRELCSRFWDLRTMFNMQEIIKLDIEAAELDIKLRTEENPEDPRTIIANKKTKIEIAIKSDQLSREQKRGRDKLKEAKVFFDVINELLPEIPDRYKNENGFPERDLSELDYWMSKQYIDQVVLKFPPEQTPHSRNIKFSVNDANRLTVDSDKA